MIVEITSKKKFIVNCCDKELSLIFITPGDYAGLLEKGVASMILERDEGGFFKKVFNVHPHASQTQTLDLNEVHQLIEFGPDYPFSSLNFKFGKILNYFIKPLSIIKALVHLIRRERVDLIRATDPFWCGFYAWAASKLTGIPFCVSIHADYDKCYRLDGKKNGMPLLYKILERFVLSRAQLVMPIREYLAQKLLNKGVSQERIRVIPHGVDIEIFLYGETDNIQKNFRIDPRKKVISFVGRLANENYIYDMIELTKRLSKLRKDFIVLLVGDGPEREKLEALALEYNLSPLIMFTGFQPREKVISIRLQSSLALCLMGGFSLIEACVSGCPPISYDIEWHYELVKNGKTGFLIKENDLDGLTEAVVYLLDHPYEAQEMGTEARKLAIARHDLSSTSEVKRNCYRELLQYKVS
jgi:glycosyltransferase involved in cell wall biosynthesis